MQFKKTFKTVAPHISNITAYGTINKDENVEMITTLCVDPDTRYGGWYETYDADTNGERFYAEGTLKIEFDGDDCYLIDYDGVFELMDYLLDALVKEGINIDKL